MPTTCRFACKPAALVPFRRDLAPTFELVNFLQYEGLTIRENAWQKRGL
jgi:hypothetical protein